MPQPMKGTRFGGSAAHHEHMMENLATELFRHGRIRTTHRRAKTVQPLAEKMITFAKRGDVHARRQVLRVVHDRDVVHKLFADIGPAFAERDGGYTRVLKLGPRKGDAAPMALIELVEGVTVEGEGDLAEQPRRRWSLRRRRGGTLSAGAQAREEELAAATDRGELTDVTPIDDEHDEHDHDHDHDEPAHDTTPRSSGATAASALVDPDGPQADPAEVEARLAAEEETVDEVEEVVTDPATADEEKVDQVEEVLDEAEADRDGDDPPSRT